MELKGGKLSSTEIYEEVLRDTGRGISESGPMRSFKEETTKLER